MSEKPDFELVSPMDFHIDPEAYVDSSNATHSKPRWWHKFIFWRTYRYPELVTTWVIKKQTLSTKQLRRLK